MNFIRIIRIIIIIIIIMDLYVTIVEILINYSAFSNRDGVQSLLDASFPRQLNTLYSRI